MSISEAFEICELLPLWIRYLDEPIAVDRTGCTTVAALTEKAQKAFSPQLDSIPMASLSLHHYSGAKLRPGLGIAELLTLDGFFNDQFTPLFLRRTDPSQPVVKRIAAPHPSAARRKRWRDLNSALFQAALEPATNREEESTSPTLNWGHISPVYENIMNKYSQSVSEVPHDSIVSLNNYLSMLTQRSGPMLMIFPTHRLHLIVPIIVYASSLVGPGDTVRMIMDTTLRGEHVKASAHFDLMLHGKTRKVCISGTKPDFIRGGEASTLVGTELMSEMYALDVACGVVTNYSQWIFLKSHNDRIERDADGLSFEMGVPTVDSLKRIVGKICSMLSDD